MGRLDQDDWGIAEDAAKWFHRMQGPDAEASRIAFEEWYEESPVHQHEYFLASFVGMQMASMRGHAACLRHSLERRDGCKVVPLRRVDLKSAVPGLVARGTPHGKENYTIRRRLPARALRHARIACAAAAAVAVLVLGFVWNVGVTAKRDVYSAGVGEHRTLRLEDRTVLELNTRSRVAVSITKEKRALELIEGEVFLDVGRDPRPFEVRVGSALIEDVGTRFGLRRKADSLDIAVESGEVNVSIGQHAVQLTAGETTTTSIRPEAPAPVVRTVGASQIGNMLAWRAGELVFAGETLADVVEEINRYNARQIQIADPKVAQLRLGGRFRATEPEEFTQLLSATFHVAGGRARRRCAETQPIRLVGLAQ